MAIADADTALRDVTLFRQMPDDERNALARQMVERRYARNQIIFSQGDSGDGLYIVTSGHASIARQSPQGDELILAVYEQGEYFGELALFDEEARSASAQAIDDCTALFLSRQAFLSFVESHPSVVLICLRAIVMQLRRLTDLADEIALLDVRSRLARRLLRLAEQGVVQSDAVSKNASQTPMRITQQQIASMTGATRESVNKHLNAFVDEGIITLQHGHIHILDLKALEECSEGL